MRNNPFQSYPDAIGFRTQPSQSFFKRFGPLPKEFVPV